MVDSSLSPITDPNTGLSLEETTVSHLFLGVPQAFTGSLSSQNGVVSSAPQAR